MIRLLSIVILVLSIVLAPPAVLAFVSNNAVPGDATYPIKRSLENIILAVVSINPNAKAAFSQTRSDRRYKEFNVLITQGKNTSGTLNELVQQTDVAVSEIALVSDPVEKAKLVEQLSQSIGKYDAGIQQYVSQGSNTPASQPADNSRQNAPSVSEVPTTSDVQTTPTQSGVTAATQPNTQAAAKQSPIPSASPLTRSTVSSPTPGPSAALHAAPVTSEKPATSNPSNDAEKQIEVAKEARKRLEEINKRLEEEKKKSAFSAQEQKNESNTDNEKKAEKSDKKNK